MAKVDICKFKKHVPCKESYRLDDVIVNKIEGITEFTGLKKSDVARALFNFGLDYFYNEDGSIDVPEKEMSALYCRAMVNEKTNNLSEPSNVKITKIQMYYLKHCAMHGPLSMSQAVRFLFHVGIDKYDRLHDEKINKITEYTKEKPMHTDLFNIARDLVVLNCWDKQ